MQQSHVESPVTHPSAQRGSPLQYPRVNRRHLWEHEWETRTLPAASRELSQRSAYLCPRRCRAEIGREQRRAAAADPWAVVSGRAGGAQRSPRGSMPTPLRDPPPLPPAMASLFLPSFAFGFTWGSLGTRRPIGNGEGWGWGRRERRRVVECGGCERDAGLERGAVPKYPKKDPKRVPKRRGCKTRAMHHPKRERNIRNGDAVSKVGRMPNSRDAVLK